MFDFDDDFGLDDLIEADIQYGLFEDDAPLKNRQKKESVKSKNSISKKQALNKNLKNDEKLIDTLAWIIVIFIVFIMIIGFKFVLAFVLLFVLLFLAWLISVL